MDKGDLKKKIAEWNGNPADYPRWEPSDNCESACEYLDSLDPETEIHAGEKAGELAEYLRYLDQHDYWKRLPAEVRQYRRYMERDIGECSFGEYVITATTQKIPATEIPWDDLGIEAATEGTTLVISLIMPMQKVVVRLAQPSHRSL